jgi:predicted aspartyl protease
MLEGKVNRHGEPRVSISLILHQRPVRFAAVLDTGFNGYLSVPTEVLTRGDWQPIGTETYEIATGALVEQEVYWGEIIFDGVRGPVYAIATNAQDLLIGTKLLRAKVLTIDFHSRQVTIT